MIIFFVLLIGVASAANVICTDYGKDVGGGGGGGLVGYYARPVPTNCRFRSLGNWSPQFRIKEGQPECKGGWKNWKNKCYLVQGEMNWRDAEQFCNRHQAHIWQPNDREEYLWVEKNIMTHTEWYYLGTVCNSAGQGLNVADFYTASGEDMRVIQRKLNAKMYKNFFVNNHSHPCMMSSRNDDNWRWIYHNRSCNERHRFLCEAPMV